MISDYKMINKDKNISRKIYGYARVSTVQQKEDRQIIALENMGVAKENIFIDKQTAETIKNYMTSGVLLRKRKRLI